jgi:polysaccharide biosynthesis protein PslA
MATKIPPVDGDPPSPAKGPAVGDVSILKSARAPELMDVSAIVLRLAEPALIVTVALVAEASFGSVIADSSQPSYVRAALLVSLFYAGLAEAIGAYDVDVRFSMRNGLGRVLTALFGTAMFAMTVAFFLKASEDFSRLWAITWFLGSATSIGLARLAVTGWLQSKKRQGLFNQSVAIFGAGEQGERLARYIKGNDRLTIDLIGFFDDRADDRVLSRPGVLPLRGSLDNLVAEIRANRVDQVIIALPWSAEVRLQDIVSALAVTPVRIRLAPDLASFAFAQRPLVLLGDLPVMTLFERPISGLDRIIKRFEDIALLLILLPLALPILLIAAAAIRLDSAGPIFFRQEREGFNNKSFRIFKFRSMRTEQLEYTDITQASRNDPRITRVGAFLRKTSIDELPQLLNVLSGDMSLVGPRPHAASTRAGNRVFGEIVTTYAGRHNVKPGITGWAQVNGWRGETDTEEKLIKRLEHDLHYIENWSVGFDFYILIRTVWAIITRKTP